MPSVAKQQDEFKLKTLEAMAAGQDPYGKASKSVSAAEDDAMRQASGDAVTAIPGHGALAADINSGVTQSSNAVQDYLATMGQAQNQWDAAFDRAAAGYAPPPIYSSSSGGGGAAGGLSGDDLAINPQVFPESYGGGLRYGGFRTQAEANAAVLGAAERSGAAYQKEDDAMALRAEAARQEAARARAGFEPQMGGTGVRRPLMGGGINAAEEGKQFRATADQRARAEVRTNPSANYGDLMEQARVDERALVEDMMRVPTQPVVSRGNRMAEEERNDRSWRGPEYEAQRRAVAASDEFAVPEDWELNRQAALDWGFNPYIAEGLYGPPSDAERNAAIRAELELSDRMLDPEGRLPSERQGWLRAMDLETYGPEVVEQADAVGITPDEYLSYAADPAFEQAVTEAAQVYAETGGNLDQVESYLIDYGLSPAQIQMVLAGYSGLGVNTSAVTPGYELGG